MSQLDLFDIPALAPAANLLEDYCDVVVHELSTITPLEPEPLGAHFSAHFNLKPPIVLRDQVRLARKLGIKDLAFTDMPRGLPGFNAKVGGAYSLYIRELDHCMRQEHTFFHELYELLVTRLREIAPDFSKRLPIPKTPLAEHHADRFAGAILMPPENFTKDALDSGLDIVELRRMHGRSYSSVLIHLARMMIRLGVPFIAWLYEKDPGEPYPEGEMRLAYRRAVLGLSNRSNPVLASHMPQYGENVISEGIARLAYGYCDSVYIGRATHFDFFGFDDLSLLARPVVWGESDVAKIIVIGVRWDQRELLQPQLDRLDPRLIPSVTRFDIPKSLFRSDQYPLPLDLPLRAQQPVGR